MTVLFPQPVDESTWRGADWPLGAHLDAASSSATFAVYAPLATRVQLELYSAGSGMPAFATYLLKKSPMDGVWRAKLSGIGAGAIYGYRVWGPNWPYDENWQPGGSSAGFISDISDRGNRFNPNKVLFDPYAREITHNTASPEITHPAWLGNGGDIVDGRPRREHDTALFAPKGIVIDDATSTGTRPLLPPENAYIYEAHVTNLTRHPSAGDLPSLFAETVPELKAVPEGLRGTFAGAALLAPYLKTLGITALELLPVHQTNSPGGEVSPEQLASVNHWGYQTISFFAPNREYAHDKSPGGPTREFKEMVAAFHQAGIEVYLDVVYNHTGEGGHWNNDVNTTGFVTLGGFSAVEYYQMTSENRLVDGATGCANQLNLSSACSQNLVLDSLHYWADEMGVDGFRFDLAPVLGREPDQAARDDWAAQRRFFSKHPLLLKISEYAEANQLEIIAEAWDLWGYEVGNFPAGWAEWNGRFRDEVRAFLKGDGNALAFVEQFNGDWHHFRDQGGPAKSINFVTAHDGFTLMDLVSFNAKTNASLSWPFGPSDGGSDNNLSWDSGGDQALRRTRLRNFLTVLLFSRGVPMIVSGDEYGRTQNGNNNPWNLNSIGIWNNYAQAVSPTPTQLPVDSDHPQNGAYYDVFGRAGSSKRNPVFEYAAWLGRFRQDHPSLRHRSWGDTQIGGNDVSYLFSSPDGLGLRDGDRAIRVLINGAAVGREDIVLAINMHNRQQFFALPGGLPWRRVADTAATYEVRDNLWPVDEADRITGRYVVEPWSIAIFMAETGAQRSK